MKLLSIPPMSSVSLNPTDPCEPSSLLTPRRICYSRSCSASWNLRILWFPCCRPLLVFSQLPVCLSRSPLPTSMPCSASHPLFLHFFALLIPTQPLGLGLVSILPQGASLWTHSQVRLSHRTSTLHSEQCLPRHHFLVFLLPSSNT